MVGPAAPFFLASLTLSSFFPLPLFPVPLHWFFLFSVPPGWEGVGASPAPVCPPLEKGIDRQTRQKSLPRQNLWVHKWISALFKWCSGLRPAVYPHRDATGTAPSGLPDVPVRGLAEHPYIPGWLYAATEVGVFASEDGGKSWSTTNEGPANVCVDEVVFLHHSTTLLAATHGRGLFTARIVAVQGSFQTFGAGCKGSGGTPTLALDPSTKPFLGGKLKVEILHPPVWQYGWMILGASNSQAGPVPLPLDLGAVGMAGCKLYVSPDFLSLYFSNPVKNVWETRIPQNPVLLGSSFFLQYLSKDPGTNPRGLVLSNAAKVTLGG